MDVIIPVFLLLFLTFLSGYFSATETAFFSLSSSKVKTYRLSSDPRKQLTASLLSRPRDLLVTVFMLNTLVNILLQNVSSAAFGKDGGWLFKVVVPFVITLVLGEIIPKYIGIQNNISLALATAPSINFIQNILQPIRRFTIAITAPISRFMFFFLKKDESISKEELRHVLKKSEEHGVLHEDEAELVWGYLNLQDADVREVMRPREEILYYNIKEPLSKLIHLMVDKHCSRLPVCSGTIEDLIGIISAKEYFLKKESINQPEDLIPFLAKPFYVPESTPAPLLLKRLEEKVEEIALVVDEYGSISGLITYEDLVEVVVGNISDMRDEKTLYTRAGEHQIITSSKLELSDFNDYFDVDLESPNNMVTIGGWLTEVMGEIPKPGQKFESHGFFFQVLAAEPNRIKRIFIRQLFPKKGPKNG